MKLLKVIKLHNLEEKNLLMNELSTLKGGATCGCHGSASTSMNDIFNYEYGYDSIGGGSESCGCGINTTGYNESAFWNPPT